MDSGLYSALVAKRLIIPHKEAQPKGHDAAGGLVLQPKRVPYISYPYEWCFEQYKDAALATLAIHLTALEYGMILKDASAYNIQFLSGYAVLIDTCSFDFYKEGMPWVAYGQFCRHFLAPLLLMSKVDQRAAKLMQSFIDGIPLDMASAMLKGKRVGGFAWQHIILHARMIERHAQDGKRSGKQVTISKAAFASIARSLQSGVARIKPRNIQTEWGEYYAHTNYSGAAQVAKKELVARFLERAGTLKHVWDFGANDGTYSKLAVELGAHVVAFDIDAVAVERNYLEARRTHESMLPLVLDLTAPSPAIGFANRERGTIDQRQKPDCIMMLAVIHHLTISNNLPFQELVRWLSGICRFLILEFVPKADSQVRLLLKTRVDIFEDYDAEHLESAFGEAFDLLEKQPVPDSERILYLFRKHTD
jgi:ribosomal protein L11 methylase PrmA